MEKQKYQPLITPNRLWEKVDNTETIGRLIVQPLEPGAGVTLGNALRRVLLSSIEGCAVTSVVIQGVNNEFSTLKGVVEDLLQVVLNIKGIIIKNLTGEPGTMRVKAQGLGVVKVSDIITDEHLELVNKDHVIATLSQDGFFEAEFFVHNGRGYLPAQWAGVVALQPDGKIYVDAMFSPVQRVEFHVEKTRMGDNIDYDKLTITVKTNGTISPSDAVNYATSVLRHQLENFLLDDNIVFGTVPVEGPESIQVISSGSSGFIGEEKRILSTSLHVELFLKPIEELEFSVRAHNCLAGAGVRRVIDLVNLSEDEVLKIKNFGRKSLREVKEILSAFHLKFDMNIKELDLKKALKENKGDGE